jgi:hypothetical protein
MGTNGVPSLLADPFRVTYEADIMQNVSKDKTITEAKAF